MASNETLRVRLARAQAQAVRSGRVVLRAGLVSRAVQSVSYFMLCAVLAGGEIFEGCAPFALALVGSAGSGLNAAAALGGACFGYLTLLGLVDGLRYVSAAILTFSLAFAFYDTKLYRTAWAMPAAAAAMNGCTGFIYLSQKGWQSQDVIYFTLEVLLTALCAYAFRWALTPEKHSTQRRRCCIVFLLAATLISLSGLYLFADVSVGRILAAALVLSCAWQGGVGAGAAMGVGLGLAMDLAGGGVLYAMAFGVSGAAAGLLRGGRRAGTAATFALTGTAAVLWLWNNGLKPAILVELPAACALFLLVPATLPRRLGTHLLREESGAADDRAKDYVRIRLEGAAQAFRALHESMRSAFARPTAHVDDSAAIFDRAADRVCRKCELRGTCWERDYVTTFNALNDATQTMLDRGRGEAADFPGYFASRCVHFPAFLSAVNEELTALLCRRQYANRIRDSRQAVCRQYGQLSDILAAAAADLGQELTPDPIRQRRVRQHLAVLGLEAEAAVFYDREHHLRVQINGPACRQLSNPEQVRSLTDLMGIPMRCEEESAPDRLTLVQSEPFMAVAGIAARKKDGETVSGDAGTWFKRPDGRLYVLLCDGMGSGPAANRESGLAVRLLEQFLKAGVETENALVILNSALALRGEDEGGFTTVDLLQLDLFTGQAEIYKFGAAPTYVRKREGVQRITGCSLPAGVSAQGAVRPDCTRLKLDPGDCVLMVSDGICPAGEDDWLRTKLAAFPGDSPKELARELIADGPEEGSTDDRTALVVRFVRRPAEP